jgi:hypothetical protein
LLSLSFLLTEYVCELYSKHRASEHQAKTVRIYPKSPVKW